MAIVSEVAFKATLGLTNIAANHVSVEVEVQTFVFDKGYNSFLAKVGISRYSQRVGVQQ